MSPSEWASSPQGLLIVEWTAAFFGLLSVGLTIREHVGCFPTGLVMVTLYIWVFYHAQLYADMGLQVVYIGLQIYGWHEWLHGGPKRSELRISRTPNAALGAYLGLAAVITGGLGYSLDRWTPAALPYWDSAITALSLVAQWMLAKKLLENWWFWIAVDVLAVGVFLAKGLYPTVGLYAVFLCMATGGFFQWRKTWKALPCTPSVQS